MGITKEVLKGILRIELKLLGHEGDLVHEVLPNDMFIYNTGLMKGCMYFVISVKRKTDQSVARIRVASMNNHFRIYEWTHVGENAKIIRGGKIIHDVGVKEHY